MELEKLTLWHWMIVACWPAVFYFFALALEDWAGWRRWVGAAVGSLCLNGIALALVIIVLPNWDLSFNKPAFNWLLLVIPALWYFSYRSLAGLGKHRRWIALALRTVVVAAVVFALAEIQLRQTSDKVTVIYVLDQSQSIPLSKRQAMLNFVVREVAEHRNAERGDRAGVVVFGREALIEVPPFDFDIPMINTVSNREFFDPDATNLAGALKLAQASFPEDSAKRVVIVTDGNENIGNARSVAPALRDAGIGIDVVPVTLNNAGEVVVEKVALPPDMRQGQPVDARVVVSNFSDKPVRGKLTIQRKIGSRDQLLDEPTVTLQPGKNVFSFEHTIDQPAVYTYSAVFAPEDPREDMMNQNNTATAFTHVKGKGRVLVIENWESKGDYDFLIDRLRANDIEVTVAGSDDLFNSLAELQAYDCVILANVPRSSGDDQKTITNFTDAQIQMLVRNTQQLGCGLVMLGGDSSFGAGGWANTELEKAMPVDFQIKNAKVQAVGALVMMMHASEMAQGNYWQKVIGQEALKALGPMDYCGLVHWGNTTGRDEWLWTAGNRGLIRVNQRRKTMIGRLSRMTPGDMPQFEPAMQMALAEFRRTNASVKHMIIISDGDPSPPRPATVAGYKRAGVQISTVAVGTHGAPSSGPLQGLANATGGKFYVVSNPKALPKIYQREARRVARPLVYEPPGGVRPQVIYDHEMHDFESGYQLPPLTGFVLTTRKNSELVEQSIVSPKPADKDNMNNTILASWTYGLGRTAVFTSDAGHRWTNAWTSWEDYDRFFVQMVRWAMRPVDESGKFSVVTDARDGKVKVVVTALDNNDDFINFLQMDASAVGPDLEGFSFKVNQVAPGRYEGEFESEASGSYFVTINPGTETDESGKVRPRPPILTGVTVPYSAEFRDREANLALMRGLAQIKPDGGEEGSMIDGNLNEEVIGEQEIDTFRHTLRRAISSQDVWPLFLMFCACLFFADVFVRRVSVGYDWVEPGVNWVRERVLRREVDQQVEESLQRLRNRKQAVAGQIDERRAAARFEPQVDDDAAPTLDDVVQQNSVSGPTAGPAPQQPGVTPDETDDDNYTSRLMEAKKRAFKNRERDA